MRARTKTTACARADSRTSVRFIVFLLIAGYLPAVFGGINRFAQIGFRGPIIYASDSWIRCTTTTITWFTWGYGLFIPLILCVLILRWTLSLRSGVAAILVYQGLASALESASSAYAICSTVGQPGPAMNLWLYLVKWIPLPFRLTALPCALFLFLRRHREDFGKPDACGYASLRDFKLTGTALIALAIAFALSHREQVGVIYTARLAVATITGHAALTASARSLCINVWPLLLAWFGLAIMRSPCKLGRTVQWLFMLDLARTLVLTSMAATEYVQGWPWSRWREYAGLACWWSETLPVTSVVLWYWWPVLRRRVSVSGDGATAFCLKCGYSLIGNVSPRCPECGEALGAHTDMRRPD